MNPGLVLSPLLALSTCAVQAADFAATYSVWDQKISGSATTSDSRLDFENDLGVTAREKSVFALSWDTGPGWWPDVAAGYTPIRADGRREVSQETQFLGILLESGSSTAAADADLTDLELSLRYPLQLRENAALSLGLTVKRLSGDVLIKDESDSEEVRENFDQTFPMLHTRLGLKPSDWLTLEVGANYARYRGDQAYDYRLQSTFHWGAAQIHAGWLGRAYRVNSSSYLLDTHITGPILGLGLVLR